MPRILRWVSILLLSLVFVLVALPADAQLGKLKDKLKQKAGEKIDKKVDQTLEGQDSTAAGDQEPAGEPAEGAAAPAGAPKGGSSTSEDMTLYTKYDFVPGDKVIFFDDLSREETGEFPSRWNLGSGVFEVARQANKSYILCTDKGTIDPKIPSGPLPPKYTIEQEFWTKGPTFKGHWIHIQWVNADGQEIGNYGIQDNLHTNLRILDKDLASKELAAPLTAGIHTLRVMATKSTMKCYVDNERVANVPAVDGFLPVGYRVYMDPWKDEANNPMLLGTLRYAEGGKTLREQLDEAGRIVTHGILFDSGSDRIKGESYKTLADIGQLLAGDPALRLSIEGHTDSDGADDANLALSKARASSVKSHLVETYKIDAARLETTGWGEGKPIDTNDSAEGKANNRRVELVKL